jgi:hypothetical protein
MSAFCVEGADLREGRTNLIVSIRFEPVPRLFYTILRVVVAYLRKHGMRLIIYLDDILIMSSSKEGAKADVKKAIELLQNLGFLINFENSIVKPSKIMEYLGLLINSNNSPFALPDRKATEVKTKFDAVLVKGVIYSREIASIMGNFTWAIPTMPFAQAHFRRMQAFFISKARRTSFNLNTKCPFSLNTRWDLEWWSSNLALIRAKVFFFQSSQGLEFFPTLH